MNEGWLWALPQDVREFAQSLRAQAIYEIVAVRSKKTLIVLWRQELWEVIGGTPDHPLLRSV